MKEDTVSRRVKDSLQKAADTLQKQCDSLKQQVTGLKDKICNKAGKIADAVKRKGDKALYKITQVTGMRKKLEENSGCSFRAGGREGCGWTERVRNDVCRNGYLFLDQLLFWL